MRPIAIESGATLAFLVAALFVGDRPDAMLAFVGVVVVARVLSYEPSRRRPELALWAVAASLGGLNDWISVDVVGLYRYTVPSLAPSLTTVPEWMWLGWGLVLRFVHALAVAAAPAEPRRGLVCSAWGRALVQFALVLLTRQGIYRLYEHPWLSWLPFAVALVAYAALLGLERRERRLALALAVLGPVAEALLIQVGGVHEYALGVLGGVPVWIALWWVLGALVWKDVGAALDRWITARTVRTPGAGARGLGPPPRERGSACTPGAAR